jgi:hypothetical protein
VLDGAIPRTRALAEAVASALDEVEWPEATPPKSRFRKPKAAGVREGCLELGRAAVRVVAERDVVAPTTTMHEAYRTMGELSDLAVGGGVAGE